MNKAIFYVLSIICIIAFSTILYFESSIKAFSHIITFLSIITGFCITALSIIATSNFAKELYKIEDPKDNSKTILHNLIGTFTNCVVASSITIILILFIFYIGDLNFKSYEFLGLMVDISKIMIGAIWYLTIVSIYIFLKLVFLFSKFVIQNAKRQGNTGHNI